MGDCGRELHYARNHDGGNVANFGDRAAFGCCTSAEEAAECNADGLLVCPVTHEPLDAAWEDEKVFLVARVSGRRYAVVAGVASMIPEPVPRALQSHWATWEQLQRNGLVAYVALPSANTSQDRAAADRALEAFHLAGRVLDVGCGPLRRRPAYAAGIAAADYVGLDPLPGEQPREFRFVHGIAELLPFPTASFRAVVFYSSLDHLLDVNMALREAARVLSPNGWINIWMDKKPPARTLVGGVLHLLRRAMRQLRGATSELGLRRGVAYALRLASLPIPRGARDTFHMDFPAPDDIVERLRDLGFNSLQWRDLGTEVAFSMRMVGATGAAIGSAAESGR